MTYELATMVTVAGSDALFKIVGRTIEQDPRYDIRAADGAITCNVPANFIVGAADAPVLRIGRAR